MPAKDAFPESGTNNKALLTQPGINKKMVSEQAGTVTLNEAAHSGRRLHMPFIKRPSLLVVGCVLASLLLVSASLLAQPYDSLNQLKGHRIETWYSDGAADKAARMATRMDSVLTFYEHILEFTPTVTLLILSPGDWKTYTSFPFYGMPHYTSRKTLVVAAEDNDYWKSMTPQQDRLPAGFAAQFATTYAGKKGGLTMEPFFDLLAVHELGHAYHNQGGLKMQRRWMGELFPNVLLHAYIAEKEPLLLPALTLFPEMVVATTDRATLQYNSLEDFEEFYNTIGPKYPQNYGWYQCRWHMSAAAIFEASGITGIKNLWQVLKNQKELLDDKSLAELLNTKADKSVADVMLKWN